ncbi:LysR family transcriptional regulator [Grimontia kaedaensis]|uniref:LysR family transcriptional regulator n=1 Tax=Grimontia kaedaensis TaxID=2872157 RepID=A0ABY4WV49_9GAMM|nr:LysR family transcriptional regulator [Grimontia kaedaensis]USH03453.1 LysR family transcriptional regulator [Grimontia kaedaensis]
MDIYQVDLNLLKLFDALLKEGSVTGAGARLGLSQPAASRGLARLRKILNDQLIVRTTGGWELTPKAITLSPQVIKLLDDARSIITPSKFCPGSASGRFVVATADHLAFLLMPEIVKKLASSAPGMDLIVPPQSGDNIDLIAQGDADLAIGSFHDLPARFHCRTLYEEDFVCVVRQEHPVIQDKLTIRKFASMEHISVVITGYGSSPVDKALQQNGLSRRVTVKTPHFLVAASIVADSDLILTIPRKLARKLSKLVRLHTLELPIKVQTFTPSIIWHEKLHYDPAHVWLRSQIVDAAQGL